jgi:hypothetical protein
VAFGYRASDASGFPAKLKMIAPRRDAIGVTSRDYQQSKEESDYNHEQDGLVDWTRCAREGLRLGMLSVFEGFLDSQFLSSNPEVAGRNAEFQIGDLKLRMLLESEIFNLKSEILHPAF